MNTYQRQIQDEAKAESQKYWMDFLKDQGKITRLEYSDLVVLRNIALEGDSFALSILVNKITKYMLRGK
jgi:hypothetical protein